MYECSICLALNHASRLHCQCCGTIPAMYSLIGETVQAVDSYPTAVRVFAAHGCMRTEKHLSARIGLKTVSLTYYAKGE